MANNVPRKVLHKQVVGFRSWKLSIASVENLTDKVADIACRVIQVI